LMKIGHVMIYVPNLFEYLYSHISDIGNSYHAIIILYFILYCFLFI